MLLFARIWLVVVIVLLACGLPVMGGPLTEFNVVFEKALLAGLALIPLWVFVAFVSRPVRWLARKLVPASALTAAAVVIILGGLACDSPTASAQDLGEILKPLLEDDKPVRIPDDAVVVPYDPSDEQGRETAAKVLVPYQRYVELWNLAHPDQKIGQQQKEQAFSYAGASYEVLLEDADHITVKGTLAIELYADQPADVPLALQDGVITSALLDGKPARLKANQPSPPPADQQQAAVPLPAALLTLLVEGKGRHQLEVSVRVAVTRQGGWRLASAIIPYAEATAVRLMIPQAGTNVRRTVGAATLSDVTKNDNESIDATLLDGGRFEVTWRARITPGSVDQALTANSVALIDVREDGVRVSWNFDFAFGQAERGTFRVEVPHDYLVEMVEGRTFAAGTWSRKARRAF